MKDRKQPQGIFPILAALVLLFLLIALVFRFINEGMPGPLYHRPRLVALVRAGLSFGLLSCFYARYIKKLKYLKWPAALLGIAGVLAAASLAIFPRFGVYANVDLPRDNLFGGRKVMLIVPHEDDDINLCGGVLEQFLSCGSEVDVVFATNGDYLGKGEVRLKEALACMDGLGISENHVYFLGYGDQWEDGSVHIYNMPENTAVKSAIGKTATYGIEGHPAYHDGAAYTFGNYLSDMQQVIAECRPELIFCVDFDKHSDHQATSLIAEKAIGRLLKEDSTFRPVVLKGFAYSTAWGAAKDFYARNIHATQAPSGEYMTEVNYYPWAERLRLPVSAASLSRSIFTTGVYEQFYTYKSQLAIDHADRVCNGDKVYWERRTDSLAYPAAVSASSGNAEAVNDFMLHDRRDLLKPADDCGIWVPEKEDPVKQVTITLPNATDIGWIYLYDNPSPEDNIEEAAILLEDGSRISTGKLEARGSATKLRIDAHQAKTITIEINKSAGDYAGLSEIELYEAQPQSDFRFIKLMDAREDFVYDYYMSGDSMEMQLYRNGDAPELLPENYIITLDNARCSAVIENGKIRFRCPRGQQCILTISDVNGCCRDRVLLRNKPAFFTIPQTIEKLYKDALMAKGIYKINQLWDWIF